MTNDNTAQSFIPLSIFTNNTENMAKKYHVILDQVSRITFFAIFFVL